MRAALVLLAACGASPQLGAQAPATPLSRLEAAADLEHRPVGHADQPTVVIWLASWCGHCRSELAVFEAVRPHHPEVRWLAANYKAHEEYDERGSSEAIRQLADGIGWMRFVPADDTLFSAFGSPPLIPTIFVYDRTGRLVATFDRRERKSPDAAELDALLRKL